MKTQIRLEVRALCVGGCPCAVHVWREDRAVVIFEHVFLKGDGDGEVLPTGTIIEELINWDTFFGKFRQEGATVRYKKTEFKKWMKTNFPQVETSNPSNYPHYHGLKRKRE